MKSKNATKKRKTSENKKTRTRNWFITINPNAECHKKIEDIISKLKTTNYAYIYHKADEDNKNDNHIHLCIEFENARTFEQVKAIFTGADIEEMKFKNQSYKYLIHLQCDNKRKYDKEEVKTNNKEYYELMINTDEYEKLDTQSLLKDIQDGNETTLYYVKKYGIHQVTNKLGLIKTLVRENVLDNQIGILQDQIKDYIDMIDEQEQKIKDLNEEIEKLNKIIDNNLPF